MLLWLSENIGTIAVSLVLILIVALIGALLGGAVSYFRSAKAIQGTEERITKLRVKEITNLKKMQRFKKHGSIKKKICILPIFFLKRGKPNCRLSDLSRVCARIQRNGIEEGLTWC